MSVMFFISRIYYKAQNFLSLWKILTDEEESYLLNFSIKLQKENVDPFYRPIGLTSLVS